jgi:hypothetical protein
VIIAIIQRSSEFWVKICPIHSNDTTRGTVFSSNTLDSYCEQPCTWVGHVRNYRGNQEFTNQFPESFWLVFVDGVAASGHKFDPAIRDACRQATYRIRWIADFTSTIDQ